MAKNISKTTNSWWSSNNKPAKPLTAKDFKKLWDNMAKEPSCRINPRQCLVSNTTAKKMESGELSHCIACGEPSKTHFYD